MNIKTLASSLLKHRGTTSLVVTSDLLNRVGAEGMQEALNRRWLEADTETGYLRLSLHQGMLEQMREAAEGACATCACDPCECCEQCHKHPCCCPAQESTSRAFAESHAQRHTCEAYGAPPAYGSGQPAQPAGTPTAQPAPAPGHAEEPTVGEDVIIADEGKSYQAKVSAKNTDGTYKLSFGPNRPARERMFRKEEIQRVQPGNVQLAK